MADGNHQKTNLLRLLCQIFYSHKIEWLFWMSYSFSFYNDWFTILPDASFLLDPILHIYRSIIHPSIECCCHIWIDAPSMHRQNIKNFSVISTDLAHRLYSLFHFVFLGFFSSFLLTDDFSFASTSSNVLRTRGIINFIRVNWWNLFDHIWIHTNFHI